VLVSGPHPPQECFIRADQESRCPRHRRGYATSCSGRCLSRRSWLNTRANSDSWSAAAAATGAARRGGGSFVGVGDIAAGVFCGGHCWGWEPGLLLLCLISGWCAGSSASGLSSNFSSLLALSDNIFLNSLSMVSVAISFSFLFSSKLFLCFANAFSNSVLLLRTLIPLKIAQIN